MKLKLEWVYKPVKAKKYVTFESEEVTVEEALILSEDIEKTGRVQSLRLIDQKGNEWTKKDLKKYLASLEEEPVNIKAYFDGGFQKETGLSGIGIVIYYEKNGKTYRIRKNALLEQLSSNNEAEYAALWNVFLELENLGVQHCEVEILGDSLVVINQMTEEWPVYEQELLYWANRIDQKQSELHITPIYQSVPRKANQEADMLASQAIAGEEIYSHTSIN